MQLCGELNFRNSIVKFLYFEMDTKFEKNLPFGFDVPKFKTK